MPSCEKQFLHSNTFRTLMSRSNIVSVQPILGGLGGVVVTFRCHGEPDRMYYFSGTDALEIMLGADPSFYDGEEIFQFPDDSPEWATIESVSKPLSAVATTLEDLL